MTTYEPRNDFVLFRMSGREHKGLVMPDQTQVGKVRSVLAVGPDVKGLNQGDEILVIGQVGQDVVQLPNEVDLFLTKQSNVAIVVRCNPD